MWVGVCGYVCVCVCLCMCVLVYVCGVWVCLCVCVVCAHALVGFYCCLYEDDFIVYMAHSIMSHGIYFNYLIR